MTIFAILLSMDTIFEPNNTHLLSVDGFESTDAHLRRMNQQRYVFRSSLLEQIPTTIPGIYNLGGGRQVGKTTLLKQWMLTLLNQGVDPKAIAFLSCELITDEKDLYDIVINQFNEMVDKGLRYLILDEITYVQRWERAIKYLADTGALEQTVLLISGSDLVIMQNAMTCFPGRRGKAKQVDFHYYPLSFREFASLIEVFPKDSLDSTPTPESIESVYQAFDQYLMHGGFLTAINEYAMTQSIGPQTLATYSNWIRGDVIKQGKKEHYLKEILRAISKHYASQISWRNLVSSLSIDHPQTAIDYVGLLESMDAVFVQSALIEDKLVAAPKKQRKMMFSDPFIFHAIQHWLNPSTTPFESQISLAIKDPILCSKLVEATVVTHFRRYYPTYYIKAKGEVDVAYVKENTFWPIELKWTNQVRAKDLQQLAHYSRAELWVKPSNTSSIHGIASRMLPFALLEVGKDI